MKNVKLTRAALAGSLLLGLAITAAPSFAGGIVNKKPVPKIGASTRAIKVTGAKSTMNAKHTVQAPLAKKPKSGK
jgi:hypothetical protein